MRPYYRRSCLERLESRQLLAGDLDPTFGDYGLVCDELVHAAPWDDFVADATGDSLGRIIVAATSSGGRGHSASLARFLSSGVLDTSFGQQGRVTLGVASGSETVIDVAVQPDGKIVLLSEIMNADPNSSRSVHLARLETNGNLDTSFGQGGRLNPLYQYLHHYRPAALVVGRDGAIFVLSTDGVDQIVVSKHLPAGGLDASFGEGGVTAIAVNEALALDLVQLPDNTLVVAAKSTTQSGGYALRLLHVLTDGVVDNQFGGGDVSIPLTVGAPYAYFSQARLAVHGNHLFAAGTRCTGEAQDYFVRKLTLTGLPVASFGVGGEVLVPTGQEWGTLLQDLEVVADGSVFLSGVWSYQRHPTLVRLSAAGAIDRSVDSSGFNTVGEVTTAGDIGAAVLLPGGKLVSVVSDGPTKDVRLIGFQATGACDLQFGAQGTTLINFGDAWTGVRGQGVLELSDGRLLTVALDQWRSPAGGRMTDPFGIVLTRWTAGGVMDSTYGTHGRVTILAEQYAGALPGTFLRRDSEQFLAIQDGYVLRIARLTDAGEIDSGFGADGWVDWHLPTSWSTPPGAMEQLDSIVVLDDGFLVSGQGFSYATNQLGYTIARLDRHGALVTSFGNEGLLWIGAKFAAGNNSQIQLQSDGRFLVLVGNPLGGAIFDVVIRRFDAHGNVDPGFGVAGTVQTGLYSGGPLDASRQMIVLSDNRIVVLGARYEGQGVGRVVLARFLADGQVDAEFGPNGTGQVTLPDVGASQSPASLAVDAQGRLVVSTSTTDFFQTDSIVYRLTPSGLIDVVYGDAGKVALPLGAYHDEVVYLMTTASGDTLGAGYRVTRDARQAVYLKLLEGELPPSPWQNASQPADSNADGYVTPVDALLVINYLNRALPERLPPTRPPDSPTKFLDVNGDRYATPIDALLVINRLNSMPAAEGEAERSDRDAAESTVDAPLAAEPPWDDWLWSGSAHQSQSRRRVRFGFWQ